MGQFKKGQQVKHHSFEGVLTVEGKAGFGAVSLSNGITRSHEQPNLTVCSFMKNGRKLEKRFPTNELTAV